MIILTIKLIIVEAATTKYSWLDRKGDLVKIVQTTRIRHCKSVLCVHKP